jgi:diguanylate cyclase
MRRRDGTTFAADVSSTVYATPERKVRASVIFRDVSPEVVASRATSAKLAELELAADHDALTGLRNRRGFGIAAEQALAAADRQGLVSQVVFVDVDSLKSINDASGHAQGDAAIVAIASAIDRATREADVACRLGGDEFVILAVDTPRAGVRRLVARIRDALAADPLAPPGLAFSTGSAERPVRCESPLNDLIDLADRDMYQHKMLARLRRTPHASQ